MIVNLEQNVEQEHSNMHTNIKESVIKTPGVNIDYNSREFRNGLQNIRQENDNNSENQKPNHDRMYDSFNI